MTEWREYARERVKARRKELGLTSKAAAELLDVTPGQWSQWETGHRSMSLDTLYAIANVFGVSVYTFLPNNKTKSLNDCKYATSTNTTQIL